LDDEVELLYRLLWPYLHDMIMEMLAGHAEIGEATLESMAELVCYRVEPTVRRMVEILNEKMRKGELEEVKTVVRGDPEAARKAAKYVARRLKHRVRQLIREELAEHKKREEKHN